MFELSILIAYLSYDRNFCVNESGKWYILRDSTKADNASHSIPEFNESCSPEVRHATGELTHDNNMDKIFKNSLKDINCLRLLSKKSFLSTLQMKNLEEINETKPLKP
jgi:hypothetical protein